MGKVSEEEKLELYAACDIFALPTLSEGFPLVLLEAMSMGLPIVTTNLWGIEEIMKKSCVIILTNPAFLLSEIQGKGLRSDLFRYGRFDLVLVDELHFYSAWDLTLLLLLLSQLTKARIADKFLFLSATIGGVEKLRESISGALNIDVETIGEERTKSEKGSVKHIFRLKAKNRNIAYGLLEDICKELIEHLCKSHGHGGKTLIFVPNRNFAELLTNTLKREASKLGRKYGYSWRKAFRLVEMHIGDMAQWERERVELQFRKGDTKILISVKTLEIGVNIGGVQRVIHFGLPATINDLLQREGRMGRHGEECESIMILLSPRDEKLAEEYIKLLREKMIRREDILRTSIVCFNAYFFRKLREEISQKRDIKIPKGITLCGREKLPISFYSQDRETFIVVMPDEIKKVREARKVRKYDVIYRYLPMAVRRIGGKNYVVREISNGKGKRRRSSHKILIVELEKAAEVFDDIVGIDVVNGFNRGELFTTSNIDINIEPICRTYTLDMLAEHKQPDHLATLRVLEVPRGVGLIRKIRKRIRDERTGEEYEIPVFCKIKEYLLEEHLCELLKMKTITRGVILEIDIAEIIRYLKDAYKGLLEGMSHLEQDLLSETVYNLICNDIHMATHVIINTISRIHKWREDEIEHYIMIMFTEIRELLEAVSSLISTGQAIKPLGVKVMIVMANVADLLNEVRWNEVIRTLEDMSDELLTSNNMEDLVSLCEDIIALCYAWRCYEHPDALLSLLDKILTYSGHVEGAKAYIHRFIGILRLAIKIAEGMRDALWSK